MLNKRFGMISFHFNIFSENTAKYWVLIFYDFGFGEFVPGHCISHYSREISSIQDIKIF